MKNNVYTATIGDLQQIISIDEEVIGHKDRMDYIEKAIERKQCIITKDSVGITGFLIYDTHFF